MKAKNLFKEFAGNLHKTDTGEFQVDLFKARQIERVIKDEGLLDKCLPPRYDGSLAHFVAEVTELLDNGYEIKRDRMDEFLKECDKKLKRLQTFDPQGFEKMKKKYDRSKRDRQGSMKNLFGDTSPQTKEYEVEQQI